MLFRSLPLHERWPLMVGLAVPLVLKPFFGPVPAIVGQLLAVAAVSRSQEAVAGALGPIQRTVVRALEIEVALVTGSLLGRIVGILLLGTVGWTLGDVVGTLIVGTLVVSGSAPAGSHPAPTVALQPR